MVEVPFDEGAARIHSSAGRERRSRSVFSFDRWDEHRSTSRYFRHLFGVAGSRTFRGLAKPLLALGLVSVAAGCYESLGDMNLLPSYLPSFVFTEGPLEITSFALSLLLVFRTDSSYSRWNDALSSWSTVGNTSKELARVGMYWVKERSAQLMLARWIIAFPKALQCHLRPDCTLEHELQGLLLPHELAAVERSDSAPYFVLQVLSGIVETSGMAELAAMRMFAGLQTYSECVGACDKILRYPIPLSYTRHSSRFMTIWLSCLPFALWDKCHWACVPVTVVLAYLLLGIEDIGVWIEQPFDSLPIEDICADVQTEVNAMLGNQDEIFSILGTTPERLHNGLMAREAASQAASARAASPRANPPGSEAAAGGVGSSGTWTPIGAGWASGGSWDDGGVAAGTNGSALAAAAAQQAAKQAERCPTP